MSQAPDVDVVDVVVRTGSQLLGVSELLPSESIFKRGGDSMLAVRFVWHLRETGLPATLTDLFESPTLEDFARAIALRLSDGTDRRPEGMEDGMPT
jgi:aryl carrier-like protein